MLREDRHGDVIRLVFESWQSRSMGFSVGAYAVRGTLIDTAFPHVGAALSAWLGARRPRGVIVTHAHEDHAGNVARVAQAGLPMWISPGTLERIRHPSAIGWYRRWCWGSQQPLAVTSERYADPSLQALPAPGHSADHHVVWDAETGTVFGADLFLGVKVRVSHPWPRQDVRREIASLRQVLALGPKRYFDAHRGLLADPVGQLSAKADWMGETVGRIDARIAEGWDDGAIQLDVLGPDGLMALLTAGDYSRRNFVGSVRATYGGNP